MITAVCCVQPPIRMSIAFENFKKAWGGLINWHIGRAFKRKILNPNLDFMQRIYKEKYNIDLKEVIEKSAGFTELEGSVNTRVYKMSSLEEYHEHFSGATHLSKIVTPTLLYYTKDDPIINDEVINAAECIQNEHIVVAST